RTRLAVRIGRSPPSAPHSEAPQPPLDSDTGPGPLALSSHETRRDAADRDIPRQARPDLVPGRPTGRSCRVVSGRTLPAPPPVGAAPDGGAIDSTVRPFASKRDPSLFKEFPTDEFIECPANRRHEPAPEAEAPVVAGPQHVSTCLRKHREPDAALHDRL